MKTIMYSFLFSSFIIASCTKTEIKPITQVETEVLQSESIEKTSTVTSATKFWNDEKGKCKRNGTSQCAVKVPVFSSTMGPVIDLITALDEEVSLVEIQTLVTGAYTDLSEYIFNTHLDGVLSGSHYLTLSYNVEDDINHVLVKLSANDEVTYVYPFQ